MYQNGEKVKNVILYLTDFACIFISFIIADIIWLRVIKGYSISDKSEQINAIGVVLFSFLVVVFLFNVNKDFFKRERFEEFLYCLKINLLFASVYAVLLFIRGDLDTASRGVYIITLILNILIMFCAHIVLKYYLIRVYKNTKKNTQLFIITTSNRIENVITGIKENKDYLNRICGAAIIDNNIVGQQILGVHITADFDSMVNYVKKEFIDEVILDVPYASGKTLRPYIMEFENMGVVVHLNIEVLEQFNDFNKSFSIVGDIPVITFANNFYDANKMLIKRLIDIVGALVGLVITLLVTVILAPILLIESRGPLIFKQKRVGKNGRYFYLYKFRSMYKDAEERKKALEEMNEMKGLMFKIKDDPRISRVGRFIRKTSIDELPQFYNVLRGDMSLVGTRPPTVEEFKLYEGYHKRRLSFKPGITGLWQVSGRNNIEDFEEVVKLDLEYIDNWSIGLDIKILIKTVTVVFKHGGAS